MIRAGERISTPACRIDVARAQCSYRPELKKNIRTLATLAARLCLDNTFRNDNSPGTLDFVRAFWELQTVSPAFKDATVSMLRGEKSDILHYVPVISVNDAFVAVDTTFSKINGQGTKKPLLVVAPDMEQMREELTSIYLLQFFPDETAASSSYMRTSFLEQRASVYRRFVQGLD